MLMLITYDVNTETADGRKRLRKVAKICVNYGQRVQNSVFECKLSMAELESVKRELLGVIDEEKDSIRFYNIKDYDKILQYGNKKSYNPDDVAIF